MPGLPLPIFEDCAGEDSGYADIESVHVLTRSIATAALRSRLGETDLEAWLPPESAMLEWQEDGL